MKPNRYWHNFENCRVVAETCSSKSEFHKKYRAAYRASKQEGWFEKLVEMFWNYDEWTFDMCQSEAAKFEDIGEFFVHSRFAYNAANKNGWLDIICAHMPASRRYWTLDRIKEDIRKNRYKSRTDFAKQNEPAYRSALNNGWLDDLCSYMKVIRRKKFNKEDCIKAAQPYNFIVEFINAEPSMYNAARRNGWLVDVCAHMHHKVKEWTDELLECEAKKYKHKIDFSKECPSAYVVASRKGIIDKICAHMNDLGDLYNRAIYAWEFPDKTVYVGLTCDLERREQQHLSDHNSPVYKHIKSTGFIPSYVLKYDYVFVGEAKRLEGEVLAEYIHNGWKKLNTLKTGGIGATKLIYTEELIRRLLATCKSREEFRLSYSAAYSACSKRKLMHLIDEFFPKIVRKNKYGKVYLSTFKKWDDNLIWDEVKKYTSCKELLANCRKAYRAAEKWGLLDDVKVYYKNLPK